MGTKQQHKAKSLRSASGLSHSVKNFIKIKAVNASFSVLASILFHRKVFDISSI